MYIYIYNIIYFCTVFAFFWNFGQILGKLFASCLLAAVNFLPNTKKKI